MDSTINEASTVVIATYTQVKLFRNNSVVLLLTNPGILHMHLVELHNMYG